MSCPTCDHTLQTVFVDASRTIRHYPRCGSMVSVMLGHTEITVPYLVDHHRDFLRFMEPDYFANWLEQNRMLLTQPGEEVIAIFFRRILHQSGVSESILPPEERPKIDNRG